MPLHVHNKIDFVNFSLPLIVIMKYCNTHERTLIFCFNWIKFPFLMFQTKSMMLMTITINMILMSYTNILCMT